MTARQGDPAVPGLGVDRLVPAGGVQVPTITVAEALETPALKRGLPEVLAGAGGLDAPIRWVHAGEVAHIADTLTGGELLLTTGMGVGTRAGQQRRFVVGLADRGIAALVIELGHTFSVVPPSVVRAAEEVALPLVALRREVPFIAVTEAIHTAIVNAHYALLRRADEVQDRLHRLLLAGDGIPEVLEATAETLDNPVFLEDHAGRLVLHAAGVAGYADTLGAWQAAAPRLAAGDVTSAGIVEPVPMGSRGESGRLIVLSVHAPLDASSSLILRRAAGVVSLALLRARQDEILAVRERGSVLVGLMDGTTTGEQARRQAAAVGFSPEGDRLVGAAAELVGRVDAELWAIVLRDVRRLVACRDPLVVGQGERPGCLVAVVAVSAGTERQAVAERFAVAVKQAVDRRLAEAEPRIAISSVVGWGQLGTALHGTRDAAAAARALPYRQWYDASQMDLHRLLWRLRDDPAVDEFLEGRLGPLRRHDEQRKRPLLPTLQALCDTGWSKTEAARALHLTRQALYRRVERIEGLLDVDLGDPEQALAVQLALLASTHERTK